MNYFGSDPTNCEKPFTWTFQNPITVSMAEVAVGQLEDNAAKRKERLLALKRKLGGGGQEEGGEGEELLPTPVFRSYRPEAEELAGQGGRGPS